MTFVSIQRQLLPIEHQQLRHHIPEINRLGDLGIKWRRLGEAGTTLLERGEHQRATEMDGSLLVDVNPATFVTTLEDLPTVESARERLMAKIIDVTFLGSNRFLSIAYMLDSEVLEQERQQYTDAIDAANSIASPWRRYEPYLSIATVERFGASEEVLQAFYDISPEEVTLLPVVVKNS